MGLDNVELAKERVRNRVANGGHGIAEEDIERRYIESNNNFSKVIGECDLIAVYDNTEEFGRFAIYKDGKCVRISSKVPAWFSHID